jgi:hypothetical protein
VEGHGDPRYESVFFNHRVLGLPCPFSITKILLYLYHTRVPFGERTGIWTFKSGGALKQRTLLPRRERTIFLCVERTGTSAPKSSGALKQRTLPSGLTIYRRVVLIPSAARPKMQAAARRQSRGREGLQCGTDLRVR